MTTPTLSSRATMSGTPACHDHPNPEAFFPHDGELIRGRPPARARQLERDYCRRCPVLDMCAATADATKELGLWGGTWRYKSDRPGSAYQRLNPATGKDT